MTGFDLVTPAYAQAGGAPPGGPVAALMPIIVMFVIFYFLLIRPQQKRVREHQELVDSLERGDEVVTQGGVHGVVRALTENDVKIEVADGVVIRVERSAITRRTNGSEKG
ncbi:MAG: preprotein translocase subunit YajC [Candidatus Dadabacteria bacterium]|nr:MAG: preprotein translocase subunit YajC [Candidatus Dadabacteria bacterium]